MFLEIKIRKDGKEQWVNAHKFFEYMIKEYSKVKYTGKSVDPYEIRVNNFYDNIPDNLIQMWTKAYPNVDIKGECERSRVWLLSNTNKAKKDFKGFTNRWLGKACQNGGSIPVQMEHKVEKQIKKHKEYMNQAQEDSATAEERRAIIEETLQKLSKRGNITNG
jgi:hypothetical protein